MQDCRLYNVSAVMWLRRLSLVHNLAAGRTRWFAVTTGMLITNSWQPECRFSLRNSVSRVATLWLPVCSMNVRCTGTSGGQMTVATVMHLQWIRRVARMYFQGRICSINIPRVVANNRSRLGISTRAPDSIFLLYGSSSKSILRVRTGMPSLRKLWLALCWWYFRTVGISLIVWRSRHLWRLVGITSAGRMCVRRWKMWLGERLGLMRLLLLTQTNWIRQLMRITWRLCITSESIVIVRKAGTVARILLRIRHLKRTIMQQANVRFS